MSIQKPEKIYQDPKTVTEVAEMFNDMSFGEKLELALKLAHELKHTTSTASDKFKAAEELSKIVPVQPVEVVPALGDEEVREMVLDEWERKFDTVEEEEGGEEEVELEEPKEKKPGVSPSMIRFNPPGVEYGKPLGWDKPDERLSFATVLWRGVLDIDMDPSEYKRYETFMSTAKPIIYILLIGAIILGAYKLTNASADKSTNRNNSIIDKVINWGVDKYDKSKKGEEIKVKTYNKDTAPLPLTSPKTLNLSREPLTARDSAINYIP